MNPKIMYWTLTQVTLKLKKKKLYTKTMKNNHIATSLYNVILRL